MPRIVHFEFATTDPDRAIKFYQDVFGWKFQKWAGSPTDYWLVTTGKEGEPGIDGGLTARGGMMDQMLPAGTWINSIDVEDVDKAVEKILASGGTVVAPKMPVPGTGWLAYCRDPEGTAFGLFQNDPTVVYEPPEAVGAGPPSRM